MELCIVRDISTLSLLPPKTIPRQPPLLSRTHFPVFPKSRTKAGLQFYRKSPLSSKASDETETEITPYIENGPQLDGGTATLEDTRPVEKNKENINQSNEVPQEGAFADNLQLFKFLEYLDIKNDFEDTSSILVFGCGGAVTLWLSAAVVGAVDSIPVLPKVLELVGLGYTIWFISRYLIFKENRDELVAKVEQIKQQVLGSKGE